MNKNHFSRQNKFNSISHQKKNRNFTYYFQTFLTLILFATSPFYWALPTFAQTAPGSTIDNTATGSFEDPDNLGNVQTVTSNTVSVTVAEVAGITISLGAIPEEAPNTVSNAGANQGNGEIDADDVIYFTYTITNVGNDPTQFFIPGAPSNITNGILSGNIEIIAYDPDGAGATAATDLSGSPVTIPNGGISTGDNAALGLPDGSISSNGTVIVRVPIKANATLNDGDTVSVVMGDTPPNDNSAATQNQVYSAGTNDVYTQDNPDGTAGETNGTPVNGDATNNRQEASYSQEVTIGFVAPALTACPAGSLLPEQTILNFQTPTPEPGTTNGDYSVGAVYRFPNVTSNTDALVEVIALNNASVVQLDVSNDGLASALQPEVSSNFANPGEYSADFQIRFVQAGTNTPIALNTVLATGVDIDGDNTVVREFIEFSGNPINSYTIDDPTQLIATVSNSTTVNFESQTSAVNPGITLTTANLGSAEYGSVSSFNYKAGLIIGNNPPANVATSRLNSLYFECVAYNNPNAVANNPNLTLVKRITAVNGTSINTTVDDTNDNPATADVDESTFDNNPNWFYTCRC